MYWESGRFDDSGELVVGTPLPYLREGIRRFQRSLLPLERLLSMDRSEFYGHPEPVRVYSQSGMLLFYLMHRQPLHGSGVRRPERGLGSRQRTARSPQDAERAWGKLVALYRMALS
jgi:hypothetical protein